MKVTSGILGSHFGLGLLRPTVQVALALGIALALLFAAGPAAADGPYDFLVPIVLEEGRTPPKVVDPPGVHNLRQVQGSGASIAQQTSTTLISNRNLTGKTGDTAISKEQAQSFTTGSDSSGYTVTSVEMRVHASGTQMNYSVSIRADTSGIPGTTVGTLRKSGLLTTPNTWTVVSFPASGDGIELAGNTKYWLVASQNSSVTVQTTEAVGKEPGGAAGWSMGGNRLVNPPNWVQSTSGKLSFAAFGYANTPALVSAEVNGTTLVLTYDKDLYTASRTAARQFGIRFGGGALQRATAISISGRQVTLTVPEVRAGQVVTVSYSKPTSNPLKGSNDAEVDAFSDQAVINNAEPVRTAIYITYTNADDERETVEIRAASADRETLWDFFYDSCQGLRSVTTLRDYSWFNADGHRMQARNGWKWVEVQNANGDVTRTRPQTLAECASHGMYVRQQNCANADWRARNPHILDSLCPTNRTW